MCLPRRDTGIFISKVNMTGYASAWLPSDIDSMSETMMTSHHT